MYIHKKSCEAYRSITITKECLNKNCMLPHNFFVVVFNCVFIETHSAITCCSVKKTNKQKKKAQQLIKNKQNDDKLNFS